jgi:hypothetical protein
MRERKFGGGVASRMSVGVVVQKEEKKSEETTKFYESRERWMSK